MVYLNNNKANYLKSNRFICDVIFIFIVKVLVVGFNAIKIVSGIEIEVSVISKNIYPLIYFLNKHSICLFKMMVDIICYDTKGKYFRFFIVYNLLSIHYNFRIRLFTKINELDKLLSLVSLYKSVSWSEREVFDFFGIFFFEHKDLRRLLTDYGFNGYPLRKDFPLTGFIDIFYDDNQKCICYRNLELTQEYRNFNFISNWKVL